MLFRFLCVGVLATVVIVLLRPTYPEVAMLTGVATGVVLLLMVADSLFDVVHAFYEIAQATQIDSDLFASVLKIIGVGYLTEFAANVCTDAGSKSVGDKILLGGKVTILVLALPIVKALINIVTEVLP